MPVRSGLLGQGGLGTAPLGFDSRELPGPGVVLPFGPPPAGASVPHFLVPFTIGGAGTALTVEQGSVAEVVQCVANLAGTTPGTRLMVPTYGTTDPTFLGLNVPAFYEGVSKWTPRATVAVRGSGEDVTIDVGLADGGTTTP